MNPGSMIKEKPRPRASDRNASAPSRSRQRTYYISAEYADQGDRLLVEGVDRIALYAVDLRLAQHWYATAWRGRPFDKSPFHEQLLDGDVDSSQARRFKTSGLVLARCLRHGAGMPVVERQAGHPVYGSAVEVLLGEVFEAALGSLIEGETGISGLTISPMHTGYALRAGRPVGKASIDKVSRAVQRERPDLSAHASPEGTVTMMFSDIDGSTSMNNRFGDQKWMNLLRDHDAIMRRQIGLHRGYEVKTIGDAFMIAFQSAVSAVRCAVAMQKEFAHRRAGAQIRIRIGLHTGGSHQGGQRLLWSAHQLCSSGWFHGEGRPGSRLFPSSEMSSRRAGSSNFDRSVESRSRASVENRRSSR